MNLALEKTRAAFFPAPAHCHLDQTSATAPDASFAQERSLREAWEMLRKEQEKSSQEMEEQTNASREARLAQLHLAAIVASSEEAVLSKDLKTIVTS